jgi:hypothetical protein
VAPNSIFQIITTNIVNNLANSDPSLPPSPLDSGGRESHPCKEPAFSVYYPRSRRFRILSALYFSAADRHLDNLLKVCADNALDMPAWGEAVQKLLKEWKEVLALSAVLIIVNTFLGYIGGTVSTNASYFSSSMCICVIASVLIFVKGHQDMIQAPSAYLHDILREHIEHRKVDQMEVLALRFGFPYGLLIWSMVFSLWSFMRIVLDKVDNSTGACILILMILVGLRLSLWTCWRRWSSRLIEHPI